jgi:aldehyde dehydrogenase (NAD+)
MDVNAIDATGVPEDLRSEVERLSADNVKRIARSRTEDFLSAEAQSPYDITAFTEMKTVWHPMGA